DQHREASVDGREPRRGRRRFCTLRDSRAAIAAEPDAAPQRLTARGTEAHGALGGRRLPHRFAELSESGGGVQGDGWGERTGRPVARLESSAGRSIRLRGGLLTAALDLFRGRKATNRALRVVVVTAELLASSPGHRLHHLLATRAVDLGDRAELPA